MLKKKKGDLQTPAEIRILAEKQLSKNSNSLKNKTTNETDRLIHELEVHKIELEMQNEELRTMQLELEIQLEELHASQFELAESREKYYDLYNNSPVGYISINQDGIITDANLTASLLLNIELKRLLRNPFTIYIIKEDQDIYYFSNNRQRETKEKQQFDIRLKRKDKSSFWARIESIYIDNGNNRFTTRISISDINEQKNSEIELREKKVQYQNLADAGIALIWTSGADKLCNYFNQPWLDFTGRTLEQEAGNGWVEGVYPDDLERCVNTYVTAFDKHEPFDMEYRLRHVSGEYRWLRDIGTPNYNSTGDFIGYIGHCFDISRQKNIEDELKITNATLQSAMDQSSAGIAIADAPHGKLRYVNKAGLMIRGGDYDSIVKGIGTDEYVSSWKIYDLEGNPLRTDEVPLARAIMYGETCSREFLIRRNDFDDRIVLANAAPIKNEAGETVAGIVVFTDITEHKLAEEEIENNQSYLKSLVYILQHETGSIQEFLDYALEETLRLTNSKLGYIYHYNEEKREFVLNTWSKEVMKECAVLEKRTVYQLDQTGIWGEAVRQRKPIIVNDFQASHPLKKGYPEGHAHLIKYLTLPIFINDKIVGVVGVANKEKDYTDADVLQLSLLMNSVWKVVDRKSSENALNESRARYSAMIEQSNDGISITDFDGNYVEVNPKFCSMTGYTQAELLKMRVSDLIPQDGKSTLFTQVAKEKISGQKEGEVLRKDGSSFFALVTGSPVKFEDKCYVQLILRDITDQKLAEKELEKHRNHLEELVKLRTEELESAIELLKITVEKEHELNEMKSGFISTTSHEFRTPLTSILSSTELLKRVGSKWSDEKKDEHFNRIVTSIDYLTHLLDDILTLNRADSGKISFNPEKLNLHQFANECLLDAEPLMTDMHELKFNYKSKQKEFQLDPKLMKFILNNLLSNAAKYSPQGGTVELNITTDKKHLLIEVSDKGIGVPPEEVNKIFESFYRAKHAKNIAGTGLGLAIVKRAVDLHNGEITVASKIGEGTTFKVKIPIAADIR